MDIRIRVGAALEVNAQQFYKPLLDGAAVARRQANAELDKIGTSRRSGGGAGPGGGPAAKAAADERKALSQAAGDLARNLAIRKRYEQEQARNDAKALAERKRILREEATARDNAARENARRSRDAATEQDGIRRSEAQRIRTHDQEVKRWERNAKSEARLQKSNDDRSELHIRRTGWSAMRNLSALGRGATNIARDVARGAGVDVDMGAIVRNSVELQTRATDLSNSAYMPGEKGPNGLRQDPKELIKQAREVGDYAAFDPTKVMEGLQAFVAKTGDLQAGRDSLQDLAKLSRASGSALEDMVDAAGDVANALGETDNKGAKVVAIMKSLAGQGKIGAVEMKSLAVQMAKLGSAATAFEGDPSQNIAKMGAFAQMARAKGGAASATQAATSVASLINIFKTPARMHAFEAATDHKVYNTKTGMLRDPVELLVESLRATQGDPGKFKKIFANTGGSRAVEGFATVYRQAGGGEKGIEAVRAEFAKYMKVAMGDGEIQDSFNKALSTNEAKVQRFNNKLSSIGEAAAEKVLPALEQLEPVIIKAAKGFSDLVAYLASNPGEAIVYAIIASIAKAGLATVLRGGIEAALRAALGTGAGALGGAGAAGAAGAAGVAGAAAGGSSGMLGVGALAGPVGVVLAAGVGAMAYGGSQDWKKAEAERKQRGAVATAILDAPRQGINSVLRSNGIDVANDAGMYTGDQRAFAANAQQADEIEDARRKMRAANAGTVPGSTLPISGDMAFRLSMSAPQTSWSAPSGGTERPRATADAPIAPPELKSMLQVLQQQTTVLQQIAANGATNVGPPQPTGGSVDAEGRFRMVP